MPTLNVPEKVYRWMIWLQVMPNNGQLSDNGTVELSASVVSNLESGFIIASLIKAVAASSGKKQPPQLMNVRKDTSKSARATNWNFLWLTFDSIGLQFDTRIKELILAGESSLIVEVIKQLYELYDGKNEQELQEIEIAKRSPQKAKETMKSEKGSGGVLDLTKIDLRRDPNSCELSLQFMILLLSKSLQLQPEEILSLFTNHNQYLAHVLVKGINEDFTGVRLFFTLLNKYADKLKEFNSRNPVQVHSCLYAIKSGFVSKDQVTSELTINLFTNLDFDIYDWFVSEQSNCCNTLLLGSRRHPNYAEMYWNLLMKLVAQESQQFMKNKLRNCFKDVKQFLQILTIHMKHLANGALSDLIVQNQYLGEWISDAIKLANIGLQERVLTFSFIGEAMLCLPTSMEAYTDQILIPFSDGWALGSLYQFTVLCNQIVAIFLKLTAVKNPFARKMYQTIVQLFQTVAAKTEKREYLLRNIIQVLPDFATIPTHYFLESFVMPTLSSLDFQLVEQCIENSRDLRALSRISETISTMYYSDPVLNFFVGRLLCDLARRLCSDHVDNVLKILRDGLQKYAQLELKKKVRQQGQQLPSPNRLKGQQQQLPANLVIQEKEHSNIENFLSRLITIILAEASRREEENPSSPDDRSPSSFDDHKFTTAGYTRKSTPEQFLPGLRLKETVKTMLIDCNAMIWRQTYKLSSRMISQILSSKFGVNSTQADQIYSQDRKRVLEDIPKKNDVSIVQKIGHNRSLTSGVLANSAVSVVPDQLAKGFDMIVKKRKQDQIQKQQREKQKLQQQQVKKQAVRKELQRVNLLRGVAGVSDMKQFGYWEKLLKNDSHREIQTYPPELIQQQDLEFIQVILRRYHKGLRTIFLSYTNSMHSVKSIRNFDERQTRKETISCTQLYKFIKDYGLGGAISQTQVQSMVKEINGRLYSRRELQELDFSGFEQFLCQFALVVFRKVKAKIESIGEQVSLLSHPYYQLMIEFFHFLKVSFVQNGGRAILFEDPQAAVYPEECEILKQFTSKVQADPKFILPEGYKKITEKEIVFVHSFTNIKLSESHQIVLEVIDELISMNPRLGFHVLEPIAQRRVSHKVKPSAIISKPKMFLDGLQTNQIKPRAVSTTLETRGKMPMNMYEKQKLSFGLKLGLSYLSLKDRAIGEQVAAILADMLSQIEQGPKNKLLLNPVQKKQVQAQLLLKKTEEQLEAKRAARKIELGQLMKGVQEKKRAKKIEQQMHIKLLQEKRREQAKAKRLSPPPIGTEDKTKIKVKRVAQSTSKMGLGSAAISKEEQEKINIKQLETLKEQFAQQIAKQKENKEHLREQEAQKEEKYRRLREKLQEESERNIKVRKEALEAYKQLQQSEEVKKVFTTHEEQLRTLFEFLLGIAPVSLTEQKLMNEVPTDLLHKILAVLELVPNIVDSHQYIGIVKLVTKDKNISKNKALALSSDDIKLILLRMAVRHKKIFNRLNEAYVTGRTKDAKILGSRTKIKSKGAIKALASTPTLPGQQQFSPPSKPSFQELSALLREQDVRKDIYNDFGDLTQVSANTLNGLLCYLCIPTDRKAREFKFRQWQQAISKNMMPHGRIEQKLSTTIEQFETPRVLSSSGSNQLPKEIGGSKGDKGDKEQQPAQSLSKNNKAINNNSNANNLTNQLQLPPNSSKVTISPTKKIK